MNSLKIKACAAAALLALSPDAALAQDYNNTTTTDTQYTQTQEEDKGFPWGLLGLLGLAGLLGRKKSERDIHVDNRRDTR